MRFRTFTLGCKVNQYETQYVRTALLANGYEETPAGEEASAGLIIVNTCSVTGESDAKSRKAVAKLAKESPRARIFLLGCFAAAHPESARSLPGVVDIVTDKRKIDQFLSDTLALSILPKKITRFDEHARAFIKVQDGCRCGCAYCIIPKVRPYLTSRLPNDVLEEVLTLAENGYREIVLTGIHLGHYGLDFPVASVTEQTTLDEYLACREQLSAERRISLSRLLELVTSKCQTVRLRLGSLEAVELDAHLLQVVAESNGAVCPHFHLSMQSGDDTVLKAMGRRWLSGPFCDKCLEVRERIPNVALTTDVIVGFPGETDEQFLRTCELVERIGFSKVHVFRFSPRPGTKAATMPHPVPESVKKSRSEYLQKLADRLRQRYMDQLLNERVEILVEHYDSKQNRFEGTTEHYLPASVSGSGIACGQLVGATVVRSESGTLITRNA